MGTGVTEANKRESMQHALELMMCLDAESVDVLGFLEIAPVYGKGDQSGSNAARYTATIKHCVSAIDEVAHGTDWTGLDVTCIRLGDGADVKMGRDAKREGVAKNRLEDVDGSVDANIYFDHS